MGASRKRVKAGVGWLSNDRLDPGESTLAMELAITSRISLLNRLEALRHKPEALAHLIRTAGVSDGAILKDVDVELTQVVLSDRQESRHIQLAVLQDKLGSLGRKIDRARAAARDSMEREYVQLLAQIGAILRTTDIPSSTLEVAREAIRERLREDRFRSRPW